MPAKILNCADEEDVIAIVTHGGMINQLYHVLLKLPIDSNVFFTTADTGINVLKIQNDTVYIIKANMTEHTKFSQSPRRV